MKVDFASWRPVRWAAVAVGLALAGCAGGGTTQLPDEVVNGGSGPPKFTQVGNSQLTLADFRNSAFPYHGVAPNSEHPELAKPFMDVNDNGRLGHNSPRGGTLYEDTTYNDRRVLLAASVSFDPRNGGALIVFFHGNSATLARDVVERQQIVRQLSDSPLNGVLVAPQLAVDALDSSAGNFWRPGAFEQFLDEADAKLATLYPSAGRGTFARMPVYVVAYSGGYLPAAYSLAVGGAGERVRGVILLDALYGEPDKWRDWVEGARGHAFFVSAYSVSSKDGNEALKAQLAQGGVPIENSLPNSLRPGDVVFIDAGGVSHDDFVNVAWTGDPLKDIFTRIAQ
jgi:hypothetical protein